VSFIGWSSYKLQSRNGNRPRGSWDHTGLAMSIFEVTRQPLCGRDREIRMPNAILAPASPNHNPRITLGRLPLDSPTALGTAASSLPRAAATSCRRADLGPTRAGKRRATGHEDAAGRKALGPAPNALSHAKSLGESTNQIMRGARWITISI
jgi:hypothetical protein